MIKRLRGASHDRVYLTLPMHICELLNFEEKAPFYIYLKGDELILGKEKYTEEDGYDLAIYKPLIKNGAGESLTLTIPPTIVKILKYYPNQEIKISLKNQSQLVISKMWGE